MLAVSRLSHLRIIMTNIRNTKQIILVRNDIKMPKGKLAAQVAHASAGVILETIWHVDRLGDRNWKSTESTDIGLIMENWLNDSFTKICLKVESLEEMESLKQQADLLQIPTCIIMDNGRTVFSEPTITCCAIGPYWNDSLDQLLGHLKLL